MTRLVFSAAALALCVVAGQPAVAEEGTMTVRVSDLNLNSPSGARTALWRAEAAAKAFCGGEPDIRDLQRRAVAMSCQKTMVNRAVAAMNAPMVVALHGKSAPMSIAGR